VFCLSVNGLSCRIGFSILLCAGGSIGQAVESAAEPVVVFPSDINLLANGRQRVVVQQRLANDLPVDLTREALFTSSDPAVAVVEQGVVRALGEGLAKLRVEAAGQVANVDVFVKAKPGDQRLSFVGDVLPVLARAGCAGGSCHAKPKGQNGFSLSVFSFNPAADFKEIVKDERGRRVFPAFPAESLVLKKPTLAVEHEGGRRLEVGSPFYRVIHDWIAQGMPYRLPDEPGLAGISVFPGEQRYAKSAEQQLVVTARFDDGKTEDVTHLADFSSNEKEIAGVDRNGLMRVGTLSGEGVVVVRYLGEVAQARITVPTDRQFNDAVYAGLLRNNFIDDLAYSRFQKLGLLPSDLCSDPEFIRRAFIDTIGLLPEPPEVRRFLADKSPDKRVKLIDRLLDDPGYADTWANRWGDLFRPNIARVGLKSAYTIDNWIRECFAANKPYDQMVHEILTARGSTHKVGPAVIYRTRREPATLTTLFSQAFLGVRMECARCHHHPNERWSQRDFYQFAAFFAETKRKGTGISPPISAGTEFIYHAPGGSVRHPVSNEVMEPTPLAGAPLGTPAGIDPRETLADWLFAPENPFFARAMANRVWGQFFGRGIVHPVDDFRTTNPPTNPELLDALAADFATNGFDLKSLMRRIMNSRLYQISSIPNKTNAQDKGSFSRFYRRRLSAENLHDILVQVCGVGSRYDNLRQDARTAELWTTIMDSPMLESFGLPNPSRNCPVERDDRPSMVQALHLMNSETLQAKLADKNGRAAKLGQAELLPGRIIDELYLSIYSRWPSADEKAVAVEAFAAEGAKRQHAVEDLMWALINSAEFVFNH
ncbi:uncharacterized protein METZ01_LOCUS93659, partial [marine metagenome]|tara:strand:+ start:806 stop:3277 length:2472 start_codon:yes stop_codon:yes gene_type:complete